MNNTALIVDDDRSERRLITGILKNSIDISFLEAENGREALRILENDTENNIKLIILDLDMPIMGGIETLDQLQKKKIKVPVIILTGSTNIDDTVQAMKMGAADFLSKPINRARLDVSARNVLKMGMMRQEISRLTRLSDNAMGFSDLIGHNQGLAPYIQTGAKAAACHLPVLITGETGTGKEMFARAIHGESERKGKPFIAVNCGAIPEKLVESTLFGHEKGSFTGAINKALGKFQEAQDGTIFLDEVGELPLEAQVKLLRVLQQGDVEPVGAGKPVSVNVRIISATNRDLAEEVDHKHFREDLFFRLNVLHINLPPLRQRQEDIPAMVKHFVDQFCAAQQVSPKIMSNAGMFKLQKYGWPGNVRELENVINRTMALSDHEELTPDDLSFVSAHKKPLETSGNIINPLHDTGRFKTMKELEQEIITQALTHHDHNITQTARALGLAKSTLYTKIETLADKKSA